MTGGDTMVVIYQRLLLESLSSDGTLFFEGALENLVSELSLKLNETEEHLAMTLSFFQKSNLIQIDSNQNAEMLQVPALIEQETDWARYKRNQRKTQKLDSVQRMSSERPTEIEIEIEIELKKEKEKEKEDIVEENFNFPDYLSESSIESIKKGNPKNFKLQIPIAYLNQVIGKNYKFVEKSLSLIKARLKDGYELSDFKKVIDTKFNEWSNTDMEKYIRPETLFGNKFDGYLNQTPFTRRQSNGKAVKPAPKWANNGEPPEEEELTPEEAEAFFNG